MYWIADNSVMFINDLGQVMICDYNGESEEVLKEKDAQWKSDMDDDFIPDEDEFIED